MILTENVTRLLHRPISNDMRYGLFALPGGGGGVATQKKPNATANFKFGTGFFGFFRFFFGFLFCFFSVFSVLPFWPILTGLTASR